MMGQGDWKHEEPAQPVRRSLILDVVPPAPQRRRGAPFSLGYFVHKRKTALMVLGMVVIVVVPILLALRPAEQEATVGRAVAQTPVCDNPAAAFAVLQQYTVGQTTVPVVAQLDITAPASTITREGPCRLRIRSANQIQTPHDGIKIDPYEGVVVVDPGASSWRVETLTFDADVGVDR